MSKEIEKTMAFEDDQKEKMTPAQQTSDHGKIKLDPARSLRTYRDGVFRLLFKEEKAAAGLYTALSGEACDFSQIEVVTLGDPTFLGMQNDLALLANERALILAEHQSTFNPNMPTRFLLYSAEIYRGFLNKQTSGDIYGTKLVSIPRPELVILYNGDDNSIPPMKELRLSDAFMGVADSEKFGTIELTTVMYNINNGMNTEMVNRSDDLRGYVELVDAVKYYLSIDKDIENAVRTAVKKCREKGILADFIDKYMREVIEVLTQDYTVGQYGEDMRQEGKQEGKLEAAKNMLAENLPIELVLRVTNLSTGDIQALKDNLG
jgi:hypothetical protein